MTVEKTNDVIKRFSQKGVFPHQMAFTLLIPLRNMFLSPKQLIERLELKDDSIVLEVGPGPGYFSVRVAKSLAKGKLYLADIQQEMLNYARKRLDKKGICNVEYSLCNGSTFPFSDSMFDLIYMVTVLGEIENKDTYISEFHRTLKDGGILSISEQTGDPDRLSPGEIDDLLTNKGFVFDKKYGTKRNYTLNYKKVL